MLSAEFLPPPLLLRIHPSSGRRGGTLNTLLAGERYSNVPLLPEERCHASDGVVGVESRLTNHVDM